MRLTISELGERLQMFRKNLDLSQKDLAAALENGQQNQISRLENGVGGSLELVLQLVNFYDAHFLTGFLFAEEFEVIRKSEVGKTANPHHFIAVERLKGLQKLLQTEVSGEISDIINVIQAADA